MNKKVKLLIFIFSLTAMAVMVNFALAADFGIEQVSNTISLSQEDPRVIVGRIIQIALSFLGVVAVLLIIYAGFLWMTSGGDEDKVSKAKRILKNGVIGLVIILSSWAITTFILSKLLAAIGGGDGNYGSGNNNFVDPGMSAIGACTVETFYPESGQTDVARNSSIMITFKEAVEADSVCVDNSGASCACGSSDCNKINPEIVRIYKTDLGDACAGSGCPATNANITAVFAAISSDGKTLVFTPAGYLGDPDKSSWYSVKITSGLKKSSDGSSMFKDCGVDYFNWKFTVGTKLDLTPPQVVYGSTFPRPDNDKDVENQSVPAQAAQGSITVAGCPGIYRAAAITGITPIGSTPAASASALNYRGALTRFRVIISPDSSDRAQLFDADNPSSLLGAADFDTQGNAKFNGYFILKAAERQVGNAWDITMTSEQLADTLAIGDELYTFSSNPSGGNNIYVNPGTCNAGAQAGQIYAVLSGSDLVNVARSGNVISLTAKTAGTSGNNIAVNTTNADALVIQAMKGGVDRQDLAEIKDKKDTPMNTVIQLNFSEAVNPLQVAGLASEVSDYIRLVNYNASSSASSTACVKDSDCRSYKCEGQNGGKICIGDYVGGKFLVSNSYKTLEFISNEECGVNGCGDKIYCLPANSHLAIEMESADLKSCVSDNDCLSYNPYRTCSSTPLGYNTCQNAAGQNYPAAASVLDGIIDTASNSFDGDRNIFSDGPISFYNDNYGQAENIGKKDSYRWSFYVNDKIMLAPPQIEAITPVQGATGISLADPIKIIWNTLMMNSSLTTGSREVNNGSTTIEHKLINLKSSATAATGYWIDNDNIDSDPLDGVPDKTISWIKHTPFSESMSYRAQAGSGINDIYQNCFKPSAGPNCSVTETNPSCCFGVATSTLGADGNCR